MKARKYRRKWLTFSLWIRTIVGWNGARGGSFFGAISDDIMQAIKI